MATAVMNIDDLLAKACNPLHTDAERLAAYNEHEAHKWFLAVLGDRLKVTDLQSKWVEPVKALIIKHAHLR